MWIYSSAGTVQDVIDDLTAIDPATLETAGDRIARTALLGLLGKLPAAKGIVAAATSAPDQFQLSLHLMRIGSYAT